MLYFQSRLLNSCLDSKAFSFQVSIAVGLAAFACVLLVVLFIMINKYGRRSKFGMKGTCNHFSLAGGTFQDCPALIAHVERCCDFIPMLSVLVQSLLKRMLSSPLLFVGRVMEIYRLMVLTCTCFCWAEVCVCFPYQYITACTGCPEELWACSFQLCVEGVVLRAACSWMKFFLQTWCMGFPLCCTGCRVQDANGEQKDVKLVWVLLERQMHSFCACLWRGTEMLL